MNRRLFIAAALASPLVSAQPARPTVLAVPTREIIREIDKIRMPVIELGSGDGYWLEALREAGIHAIGYDPEPRGPLVQIGDHRDAARHPDRALLIVWPPDGTDVSDWIEHYAGEWVILVSDGNPFYRRYEALGFDLVKTLRTTGYAGDSSVGFFRRVK